MIIAGHVNDVNSFISWKAFIHGHASIIIAHQSDDEIIMQYQPNYRNQMV